MSGERSEYIIEHDFPFAVLLSCTQCKRTIPNALTGWLTIEQWRGVFTELESVPYVCTACMKETSAGPH